MIVLITFQCDQIFGFNNTSIAISKDSTSLSIKKNGIKFKLSGLQVGKISMAYERIINSKYNYEIEPTYYLNKSLFYNISQFMIPNIGLKREGAELKLSIGRYKAFKKAQKYTRLKSASLQISYRYQHTGNFRFWEGGFSGRSEYNHYRLSQTKNLLGLFFKASAYKTSKLISLEHFLAIGFYTGFSRTVVFEIDGRNRSYPNEVYDPPIYQPNGFTIIPVLNAGILLRFNFK